MPFFIFCLLALPCLGFAQADPLASAREKLPGLQVIELPESGDITLTAEQSVTIENLRGVMLDDNPPVSGTPNPPHELHQTDGLPEGIVPPFVAEGISPFRFKEFNVEFNYGGWHNLTMIDYATTHGFENIYPYVMQNTNHWPEDTKTLRWGSFVDWNKFCAEREIPWGRWDMLAELDVTQELLDSGQVWEYVPGSIAMIDLEHGEALSPDALQKQEWFPENASPDEQAAFEKRYYAGYNQTYIAPIEALRRNGWTSIGIYPQPYGSGWYRMLGEYERGETEFQSPQTYWAWQKWGRDFVEPQDILYPDIYTYYPTPQNVPYILARMDFDLTLLDAAGMNKPYCPYTWPLLHGGDGLPHWWANQPIPTEDERAIFCLAFFAGCDGIVLWNWSEFDNHQQAPALQRKQGDQLVNNDVMVGREFLIRRDGVGEDVAPDVIRRYDVLSVMEIDETAGMVKFQHHPWFGGYGKDRLVEGAPTYTLRKDELISYLRPSADAVSGAVEGLALVKVFEDFLRQATVQRDLSARECFVKSLPVMRRMKLGNISLIATYDAQAIGNDKGREIVINDFDGNQDLTLCLPADDQVRIFAINH